MINPVGKSCLQISHKNSLCWFHAFLIPSLSKSPNTPHNVTTNLTSGKQWLILKDQAFPAIDPKK